MPLGMEVGLGPGDFVLDGDPAPPPQFSAYVYYAETAGCIKMTLGTEVDLDSSDIVLDGNPASPSPKRGSRAPSFRPISIVVKRLYGSR